MMVGSKPVLNHVIGYKAGVAGTHNRAAYAAEKRQALDTLATAVAMLPAVTSRGCVERATELRQSQTGCAAALDRVQSCS